MIITLFVQINTSTNWAYSVNMNEPFGVLPGKETSIHNGEENIPIITRAIIGFNRNVATEDVLDHNIQLIKVYDESGSEIPFRAVAQGDNSIEIGIEGGLQPSKRYHIRVGKGLAAQGGTEFMEEDHDISFSTEGSTPVEEEQPVSELDKLKEEVERAKRESEENARLMQEVEEEKRKSEEAARAAEREAKEKKQVEIPEEENIDDKDIEEAIGMKDETAKTNDDLANPKTFVAAVAILALIVIILAALIQKLNRDKAELKEKLDDEEKLNDEEDEKNKGLEDSADNIDENSNDKDAADISEDSESLDDKQLSESEADSDGEPSDIEKTGRFNGLDKK